MNRIKKVLLFFISFKPTKRMLMKKIMRNHLTWKVFLISFSCDGKPSLLQINLNITKEDKNETFFEICKDWDMHIRLHRAMDKVLRSVRLRLCKLRGRERERERERESQMKADAYFHPSISRLTMRMYMCSIKRTDSGTEPWDIPIDILCAMLKFMKTQL